MTWSERLRERIEAAREAAADADPQAAWDQLQREDEAESHGFLGGFGLGVVVGALLALIFSPATGERTREVVAERAVQLKDRATDLVAQVRGDGAEEADGDAAPPAIIEREIDEPTPLMSSVAPE